MRLILGSLQYIDIARICRSIVFPYMNESAISNYLGSVYKEKSDIHVCNLQNITSGWETEILAFEVDWVEDHETVSQKLVARIYPGKDAARKAEREGLMMKGLSKMGYPVPEVHIVELDSQYLGQPFIIMDHIEGGTIDDRLHEDEEKWTKVFHQLFVDLHQLDWRKMHPNPASIPSNDSYFYIKTTLLDYENQLRYFKKPELLPIIDWMRGRINDVPCDTLSIIHGDFHTFNILVDKWNHPFVIDWGASRIADLRTDVAWTLLLSFAYDSRELRNRILSGYENTLGKDLEHIEYFEVLATLRRLIDVTSSLESGADERGLRPEAVKMMKESAGHIDRVRKRLYELTNLSIPEIDRFVENLVG
jgi:aminoglycoside phosphotransferase (APT) family kinase protein